MLLLKFNCISFCLSPPWSGLGAPRTLHPVNPSLIYLNKLINKDKYDRGELLCLINLVHRRILRNYFLKQENHIFLRK